MNKQDISRNNVLAGVLVSFAMLALCIMASCTNNVLYKSYDDFYQPGPLSVQVISLAAQEQYNNPVQMDIYAPREPFRYPVVLFQHGFTGSIKGYETILNHLASHGFVVVAPQMYPAGGGMGGSYPSPEEEAALGVEIISWMQDNLPRVVPVNADTRLLGIAGHSRGGQIAYRIALQVGEKITALSGVAPVDGLVIFGQELAITGPLSFDIPTYILGTGLGPTPPPNTQFDLSCAPAEIGYQHFYDNSPRPSWLAVATEHGHTDMLDEADLCPSEPCSPFCPGGPDREGMRSFTAGTLAAFFSGTLQKNYRALGALSDPAAAPVACTMEKK